jgi:hypothetical protein
MTALISLSEQSSPHGRWIRICRGRLDVHYPRPGCEDVADGETTIAQKGMIMKSTMVLSTHTSDRTVGVDSGWPVCDERLVTVAEANAHRVGGATSPVARLAAGRGKK